jgi:hypothetical protein
MNTSPMDVTTRAFRAAWEGVQYSAGGGPPDPVFSFVPEIEPDQPIAAKAHHFPADEDKEEVVGENQQEHAADEEVHPHPVPG